MAVCPPPSVPFLFLFLWPLRFFCLQPTFKCLFIHCDLIVLPAKSVWNCSLCTFCITIGAIDRPRSSCCPVPGRLFRETCFIFLCTSALCLKIHKLTFDESLYSYWHKHVHMLDWTLSVTGMMSWLQRGNFWVAFCLHPINSNLWSVFGWLWNSLTMPMHYVTTSVCFGASPKDFM